jgi:HK97 family phage prohead protease
MADIEYRCCSELEFRAEGDSVTVGGYAAVFNSMSQDLGGFREVIRRGAFTHTIAQGADVRFLINHDGMPLARTKSGTLRLAEDNRGLRIDATLDPTDPDVQRLLPKMRRGDLSQMSFGFRTLKDAWRQEGADQIRELHAVDLFDVSAVTYPAYQSTEVALRSLAASRSQPVGYPLNLAKCRLRMLREKGV